MITIVTIEVTVNFEVVFKTYILIKLGLKLQW